ncbi:MAG: glycohydrolase toxin TNT-related protein, partial [Bacteroidales bacterium]|nr:glycohydrolase toxin TNT-related protein [Bacteroidales bacterium]
GISSVQYTSQDGQITTESYSYSNGHNTGITLPDNTVVWSITSENDLGLVTAITTGGITREYGFTAFGMPTYRKMDGGDLQNFAYNFNVATGNLLSRTDNINGQTETFGYDSLDRLVTIGNREIEYDNKGNILSMDGVGTMVYDSSSHPYRITSMIVEDEDFAPSAQQSLSYTSYSRPSVLTGRSRSAAFTYNGNGDRIKMNITHGAFQLLTRYYIGGRYEYEQTPLKTTERLYLGGDAYSAPMVYQKADNGNWTAYNIGRDYLGNITHIATLDGNLVAEYSYDPWGRLRNPETLEIYSPDDEPELFLGRGFTGHEHLKWFGLINMNARLYDPFLGRFLSPDPHVQSPDFTQNFNRYSYALNNPLKYTDESGEFVVTSALVIGCIIVGAAIIGGTANILSNLDNINGFWQGATTAVTGAIGGAGVAAAGIFSGGGALLLAGAGAGALTSFNNSLVAQTGKNFSSIDQLDWNTTVKLTISGAMAGAVSAYAGSYVSTSMPLWFNGTILTSPIAKAVAASVVSSAAGHISGGTTYGILAGESFADAFINSFDGIGQSIAMGAAIGVSSTLGTCLIQGINPFDGMKAYPPKNGFKGAPIDDTLEPGTIIDRYGNPDGSFAAPEGTNFSERGLPLVSKNAPYNRYLVMEPIPVQRGIAAGSFWFASPGGGTQFFFPNHDIQYYINNRYLLPL